MANRNGNGPDVPESIVAFTDETWPLATAEAGYLIDSGLPILGVSGDSGEGFLVRVALPNNVDRVNAAKALMSHALRVGQSTLKAYDREHKSATREERMKAASDGVNSALNGTYKAARETDNDLVSREAESLFAIHVTTLVKAQKPDASDDDCLATVKAKAGTDAGKEWIAKKKAEILAAGVYTPSRKGKTAGTVVDIAIAA